MPSNPPEPGDVWLADLGLAAKPRPVVIVSRQDDSAPRALVTYVPLTTQYAGSEYEVAIPTLRFLQKHLLQTFKELGQLRQCAWDAG